MRPVLRDKQSAAHKKFTHKHPRLAACPERDCKKRLGHRYFNVLRPTVPESSLSLDSLNRPTVNRIPH